MAISTVSTLPHEVAFISILCMAQLLTQAALGSVIAILQIIGTDLRDSTPGILAWFIAGYSLTVGTFILPAGRAGDLYGHRRLFMVGFAWFGIWSIIAGLSHYSHSASFFIFGRVMQGIGPAVILPNALAILGRTYPPGKRKAIIFSLFGATAPSGSILGAVFASLLAKYVRWDWSLYVLGLLCLLLSFFTPFIVPADDDSKLGSTAHKHDRISDKITTIVAEMDGVSSILGIAGLVLFNFSWNQAPIDGWQSPLIIVLLILSIIVLIFFAIWEVKYARYPLLPPSLFTIETSLILGCISTGWGAFGTWIYYGWLFLETQRLESPLLATAQFSPVIVSGFLAAIFTGLIIHRLGPGIVMIIAMFGFLLGNLFFSIARVEANYWGLIFVAILIAPFGMDASFPAANLVMSDFVDSKIQGNAASLVNTVLNYSISIGLGIAGTVEVHVNRGGKTKDDILRGYRGAWRVGIGLASLGVVQAIILTILIRRHKRKTYT